MTLNLKKTLSYIIPPVITAGLCYVLYSGIDLGNIRAGARECALLPALLFLLCNVLAMVLRGVRWRLQLHAIGVNPSLGAMSRSIFGTYAVNLVFPRLGEFWRCAYISRLMSAPFPGVFGTMVADRLSDTLMVMLICLATFLLHSGALSRFIAEANVSTAFVGSVWFWSAIMLLAAIAVWIMLGRDRIATRVREFAVNTWRGFTAIFTMPARGRWLLLTLGIWGSYLLSMYASMIAYPPTAHLLASHGPTVALVAFVFGSLAMAIPSNGGIGPWQFAIIICLSGLYGIDKNAALIFATLNLGANTLLNIALGLYTFIFNFFAKKSKD